MVATRKVRRAGAVGVANVDIDRQMDGGDHGDGGEGLDNVLLPLAWGEEVAKPWVAIQYTLKISGQNKGQNWGQLSGHYFELPVYLAL